MISSKSASGVIRPRTSMPEKRILIQNHLAANRDRIIYKLSRLIYEGRLISVVRCWGGERWPVEASEMRRNDPISGPGRLVPMRQPRITGAEWRVAKGGRSLWPPGDSIPGSNGTEGEEASSPAPGNPAAVDRLPLKQKGA